MNQKEYNICFITAARSEYGLLRYLMEEIRQTPGLWLQLIVTGGHLLAEQGHTIDRILADGFQVDARIDAGLDTTSEESIAAAMGRLGEQLAAVFGRLEPDLLVVLGDRYELLPVCQTALIMQIPIAHISGGDITEGAIDDAVRNAVSMMATWHFPGTEEAAENLRRIRGSADHIWVVGEPGLDARYRIEPIARDALAADLGLDPQKKWILCTYHPVTRGSVENDLRTVDDLIQALLEAGTEYQTLFTYANADFGGAQINRRMGEAAAAHPERFRQIPSLGQQRYWSFMQEAVLVAGNSSSGILEAPFVGVPVLNIGDRQKGRYQCGNVVQCGVTGEEIREGLSRALALRVDPSDADHWGDGHTSERIARLLVEQCCGSTPLDKQVKE
ncbi:MAG: UDP-N-acetylglucosamine 2-epimerase (hydrolyzing) [Butyrivibrio sp.]|nr:UDP-N-acetylglucosamine 2-epimerase (hydrolyzing) [Butyrivibrio sp.]